MHPFELRAFEVAYDTAHKEGKRRGVPQVAGLRERQPLLQRLPAALVVASLQNLAAEESNRRSCWARLAAGSTSFWSPVRLRVSVSRTELLAPVEVCSVAREPSPT